jgi:hypothetical protein
MQPLTKAPRIIIALIVLSSLVVTSDSCAQAKPARGPDRGPATRPGRVYDPKSVETIRGEVVRVEKIPWRKGKGHGVHLIVRTDKETIPVHLGPAWYVDAQPLEVEAKDQVEVRGSRVTVQGQPAIIAAEITKGEQSLKLRDEAGVPLWRGRRGRPSGSE